MYHVQWPFELLSSTFDHGPILLDRGLDYYLRSHYGASHSHSRLFHLPSSSYILYLAFPFLTQSNLLLYKSYAILVARWYRCQWVVMSYMYYNMI